MSPADYDGAESLPGPIDEVEEYGDTAPLPPHYADLLDATERAIADATDAHERAIADVADDIDRALRAAEIDHNGALAESIGSIDAALRKAETEHIRAVTRLYDDTNKAVILAQEELRYAGVSVPDTMAVAQTELDDPTGEMIFARLIGQPMVVADMVPTAEPAPVAPAPAPTAPPTGGFDSGETIGVLTPTMVDPPLPLPPAPPPITTLASGMKMCEWTYQRPDGSRYVFQEEHPAAAPCPWRPVSPPPDDIIVEMGIEPGEIAVTLPPTAPPPPASPPSGPTPCGCAPTTCIPICPTAEPPPTPRALPAGPVAAPIEVRGDIKTVFWDGVNACAEAHKVVTDATAAGARDLPAADRGGSIASTMMRGGVVALKTFADGIFSGFDDTVKDAAFKANASFTGDWFGGYGTTLQSINQLDEGAVRDKGAAWSLGLQLALAATSEDSTSFPMTYLTQSVKYAFQYANPQMIPDQGALDHLWLTDEISDERWRCLTRAQGNLPDLHRAARDAKQNRPDAHQVVELYLRGEIDTREKLSERLRDIGVINQKYEDNLLALATWVPGPPDIVTFMVRDTEDPQAVAAGQLDKDFELKFYGAGGKANPGPLAKWARAHGLDEDTFRRYWRAHWRLPSPTQLYEMLHRLRPDGLAQQKWILDMRDWNRAGAVGPPPPRPPIVTEADCRRALELNDIAPAWIDAIMAVSYNPMTRTDALNAFHANVMTADELTDRLQDTGLDLATATRTVELQTAMRARRNANVSGVWTVRQIGQAYEKGALTGMAADQLLTPLIPDPAQRQRLLQDIDLRRQANVRAKRIDKYRRAMFVGVASDVETLPLLLKMGIGQQAAQDMVDQWEEEKRGRYREVSAKMISDGLRNRIITAEQAYTRLANLGYIQVDAQFIVVAALGKQLDDVAKSEKERGRQIERQIKDERSARRAADRQLIERAKEIDAELRRLDQERARIMRERDERAAQVRA